MKGTAARSQVLDKLLGRVDFSPPATYYVALFTASPNETGGGTEVTGGAYARVAVPNNPTSFPAAVSGTKANGTLITFPVPTDLWGDIVAFAFMTAATGGTLVLWGVLDLPLTVQSGDLAPAFDVGSLQFEES